MSLIAWLTFWVAAGAAAPTSQSTLSPGQIAEAARMLASPSPADRIAAGRELIEAGPAAYDEMRETFRSTRLYDVRQRIARIALRIRVEEQLGPPAPFLGISHELVYPASERRLGAGKVGVRITGIVPESSAAAAGLRVGDIIAHINGNTMAPDGTQLGPFANWIRAQSLGSKCKLLVYRGEKSVEVEAVLGRHPSGFWYPQRDGRLAAILDDFPRWWRAEFDPQGLVLTESPSVDEPWWNLEK